MRTADAVGVERSGQRITPPRRRLIVSRPVLAVAVLAVALAAVAVAAIGWRLAVAGDLRLEVSAPDRDEVLYARAVSPGESFQLEHTHSVTKRPVVETFLADESPAVLLEELWFDEFGPNLPAGPERIGDRTTTFIHDEGAYRVVHHGHPIGTVPFRVGAESVDHVLTFADGERLRLLDVARAGEHVELAIRKR